MTTTSTRHWTAWQHAVLLSIPLKRPGGHLGRRRGAHETDPHADDTQSRAHRQLIQESGQDPRASLQAGKFRP